jgi:hypothetical protein
VITLDEMDELNHITYAYISSRAFPDKMYTYDEYIQDGYLITEFYLDGTQMFTIQPVKTK